MCENACKNEELARLSATIKPRAIALSTVHTVHRIINSTLNLNELVSRLAHLAVQVLRVHMSNLRRKIGARYIHTDPGVGYRFTA